MSIWSDIEDRSSGEAMRREDMQKFIDDLLEENRKLYKDNKKLAEQLDWYRRKSDDFFRQSDDFFYEPHYVVWPDKADDEPVSSIFKF
jgi:regulator of replication initiation timing